MGDIEYRKMMDVRMGRIKLFQNALRMYQSGILSPRQLELEFARIVHLENAGVLKEAAELE